MRLILVGGFPRSGSRQFTDILNAHPEISLQGEIYSETYRALGRLVEASSTEHAGKWSERKFLPRRKPWIIESLCTHMKGMPKPVGPDTRFVGLKQPYLETLWKSTLEIFSRDWESCDFFFCTRNIHDNFLSLNSAFDYSAQHYTKKMIYSARGLGSLLDNSFFRVHPISLDGYIASENKSDWLADNLFRPLELSVSAEEAEEMIAGTQNRNQTPAAKRKREIAEDDRIFLAGNDDLKNAVQFIEDKMGLKLYFSDI